jgi:hypothetical protein
MALGPLLSLVLARVPTTRLLGLTINPITVAGWIMLATWLVFIATWVVLFKEPLAQCAPPSCFIGEISRVAGSRMDPIG